MIWLLNHAPTQGETYFTSRLGVLDLSQIKVCFGFVEYVGKSEKRHGKNSSKPSAGQTVTRGPSGHICFPSSPETREEGGYVNGCLRVIHHLFCDGQLRRRVLEPQPAGV